jgi:hypothetical protein
METCSCVLSTKRVLCGSWFQNTMESRSKFFPQARSINGELLTGTVLGSSACERWRGETSCKCDFGIMHGGSTTQPKSQGKHQTRGPHRASFKRERKLPEKYRKRYHRKRYQGTPKRVAQDGHFVITVRLGLISRRAPPSSDDLRRLDGGAFICVSIAHRLFDFPLNFFPLI